MTAARPDAAGDTPDATDTGVIGAGAMVEVPDWPVRAASLAADLVAAGKLRTPAWRAAVEQVPRHLFVRRFYARANDQKKFVAVAANSPASHGEWLARVYANEALVTKLGASHEDRGGPVFLSSSSTPGLMTRMLETLDVAEAHRVLEIGTGTGYNAALLCHRLGAHNVVSIDVEPDLVEAARARLAGLGWSPTLIVGDGAVGVPDHAPFDRVIATCSVPTLPWPWIEQTRIGGVVLADLRVGMNAGNLIRLTRLSRDRAEGMFDAGQASFMPLRHTPGPATVPAYAPATNPDGAESRTAIDPRTPWANPVVWFLAALHLGGHYRIGYTGTHPNGGPRAVCITTPDGSRAEIALARTGDGDHALHQSGPCRLWRHVEHAHQMWENAGRPAWSRLGLTVTSRGQTIYLDDPAHEIASVLPGRG